MVPKISWEMAPLWICGFNTMCLSYENKWGYHIKWTEEQYQEAKQTLDKLKEWRYGT